jgi:hypothetical protein
MYKNSYFSVGEYCATAHQIRRCTRNSEAYFFDWLVTRDNSFDFLCRSNGAFLQSMGWELVDGGIRLLDRYSGLVFQHEFKTSGGEVDANLVEGHLNAAREKFLYLKDKFFVALKASHRGVIIRAENGIKSTEQAKKRLNELRETFRPINASLKFVIASTQLYQGEEFSSDHLFIRLDNPIPPNGQDAWKGNDQSWNRLFELAESKLVFLTP